MASKPTTHQGRQSSEEALPSSASTSTIHQHEDDLITLIYDAAHCLLQKDNAIINKTGLDNEECDSIKQGLGHAVKLNSLENLDNAFKQYSQTSHMGIMDPSYQLFYSRHNYGSLLYKIRQNTAVVTGDPLGPFHQWRPLLFEFFRFCKSCNLHTAFMGVSERFAHLSETLRWASVQVSSECVLNPLRNDVLRKKSGKRMISQNRQLLDPKRGGIKIRIYSPAATGVDAKLEAQLQKLYDDWREEKNTRANDNAQAFVTVYDLFSCPNLTIFLYTCSPDGYPNGFATLRVLGVERGFHLDPCIASPEAPRGLTDLLIITAMQILEQAGIGYLALGITPTLDISSAPSHAHVQSWLWKQGYQRILKSLPVSGKLTYFNKFRPDESLSSKLFVCIPTRGLAIRESLALMKLANIDFRYVIIPKSARKVVQ